MTFKYLSFKCLVGEAFKRGEVRPIIKNMIENIETLIPFLRVISSYLIDLSVCPIKKLQQDLYLDKCLAQNIMESLYLMGIIKKDENGYPMEVVHKKAEEFKAFVDTNFGIVLCE